MNAFLKGADLSTLLEVERCGGRFFDLDGREDDAMSILARRGVNHVRLRLWNDPYSETGECCGGGGCDLNTVAALAKRAKDLGLAWQLVFHYSDFWADPGKQNLPKAWRGLSTKALESAVYAFTRDTLQNLKAQGLAPELVSVGNEITNGLLWPDGKVPAWDRIARLVSSGIRAVRDTLPEAKALIHLDNGGRPEVFFVPLDRRLLGVFYYEGKEYEGELPPYKQNETKDLHYLLTDVYLNMPNGTVLMLPDKDGERVPWMIYWLEDYVASGYNRYVVLRMTHYLTWKNREGEICNAWAYFYGQEDNMLKDELKSRSRNKALYTENLKLSFFITPRNINIRKDDYIEVGEDELKEAYVVTGYDIQSTPGVEFVSVDPQYIRDLTEPPIQTAEDSDSDFFWINRGGEA